jgi:ATP-dependent protease ClpP protease subunit
MRRLGMHLDKGLGTGLAKLGHGSSSAWRRACAAAVMALSLVGVTAPAHAQEADRDGLRVTISNVRSGTVVLNWRGAIMPPMANQIRDAFEAHRRQASRFVLRISSQGGLVPEGERVIELMRQIKATHQLDTVVTQGDVCASMCVFIYLQGQKRFGALTSSWLFHEVSHIDQATKQTTKLDRGAWERLVEKYMGPAGVSESWITDMKPRTVNSDYWQTGADLINSSSGIIHEALANQTTRHIAANPRAKDATPSTRPPASASSSSRPECRKYFPSIGAVVPVPCS